MALNDQISDFLTRIRNATRAQQRYADADWSGMKENIARVLKENGFIEDYLVKKDDNGRGKIRLFLKYGQGRASVIQGIRRISTPGRRCYTGYKELHPFYGGLGVSVVSTSHGVLSDREARQKKLGGELLCQVW